jgi:hypothetical protein
MPSTFNIGDRVDRIEDRAVTGATILSIIERENETNIIEIQYDEGGSGWWPETSIRPIQVE